MRQPIDPRLHAVLDYLTGTSLTAASRLPALRRRFAGRALLAAGLTHLAYSLVTDYELGALRKLPYKLHLALDAGGALALVGAGASRAESPDRLVPIGVGMYELAAVLLSDPAGPTGGGVAGHAVTVERSEADVRAFLAQSENVRAFSPEGKWPADFELRSAPAGRGTQIHAHAEPGDLRRAKQLLEAGELATADVGPAGRRGPLSAVLPSLDTGAAPR